MKFLRHRQHSESGFTLIELLVVMLILGILAAIVLPVFFKEDSKEDSTKVVAAEVCDVSDSRVELPEKAGGTYTAEGQQKLFEHAPYRFTIDTTEGIITSAEEVGEQEQFLIC